MYSVNLMSRYMENPTWFHLLTAKRILRSMKGSMEFGLFYKKVEQSNSIGFNNSDYTWDQYDRKSTSSMFLDSV